jgi:hypothetical protein
LAAPAANISDEPLTIPPKHADRLLIVGVTVAAAGLVLAVLASFAFGGIRRLLLSYLVSYMFVLSIALGALFFVILQHATKAGWSVSVRRVPELLTRLFPLLAVMAIPIVLSFLAPGQESPHGVHRDRNMPTLYPWAMWRADDEHHDEAGFDEHGQAAAPLAQADGVIDNLENLPDDNEEVTALGGGDLGEGLDHRVPDEDAGSVAPGGLTGTNTAFQEAAADDHILTREGLTATQARHHATHIDALTEGKLGWLNKPFFLVRLVIYFAAWILLANYFYSRSVRQDATGEPALSKQMTGASYFSFVIFGLTLTFASFDLVMSLDPHFFSTIFGGYIFAGGMVGFFAVTILAYQFLRMGGLLKSSVTVEHYHDLGKWLFAFTFFWGYIAFSQFMLIWYANIPETTYWFGVRGATSVAENMTFGAWEEGGPARVGWWTVISMTLLVGHLLIPFAALLSRHVKRNLTLLGFWAGWLLVMHWVDLYWLIMPEMLTGGWTLLPVVEAACAMFVIGLSVAWIAKEMKVVKLRPAADPRLPESVAFHNM